MAVARFFASGSESYKSFKNLKNSLIIGEVQSGKTGFMLKTSLASYDNNEFDVVIVLCGSNNNLLDQARGRFYKDFLERGCIPTEIESTVFTNINVGDKRFFTTLKNTNSLSKISLIMQNSSSKIRYLIFDDESDFGGIDIGKGSSHSETYEIISKIRNHSSNVSYVAVTATPFADLLSKNAIEFNDIQILKINSEYTGIDFFNKNNIYKISDIDRDIRRGKNENPKLWLEILISHVKRILKYGGNTTQLLINNDLNTKFHRKISQLILKYLMLLKGNPNIIRESFGINYEVNDVLKIIDELVNNIYILNEKNNRWNNRANSIVIGGSLVSRGYTFERLLTTVMFNEPESKVSADTLLQRARWFGYRKDIYEFMEVYLSQKTLDAYGECEIAINQYEKAIDTFNGIEDLDNVRKSISDYKYESIILTNKMEKKWQK